MGGIQSTFDAYLCLRSLKTLAVRMQAHERNAFAVAASWSSIRRWSGSRYPGLQTIPSTNSPAGRRAGHGGMLAFRVRADSKRRAMCSSVVRIFSLAESLGGVESLIEHPALMTHASMPEANGWRSASTPGSIRLSVGIESEADLLRDLDQALASA